MFALMQSTRLESLHLSVDPIWKPLTELKGTYAAGPLAPGTSFVLRVPLA